MGFIDCASYASAWHGYEYYKENKVLTIDQVSKYEYEGTVAGSAEEPYSVHIDIRHPKKSTCNCPFAEGNMKICKHKVALYFSVFPEEADEYSAAVEQAAEAAEKYEEEVYDLIAQKIAKMKKSELQDALRDALMFGPDWLRDRFVREHIEYERF